MAAGNVASGLAFNAIGDLSVEYPNLFAEGSPQKVVLHAITGGLISEATGGDFKSGAIAAGANELLIEKLTQSKWFNEGDRELKVETLSQIIGVTAAALAGGDPEQGAKIAQQATRYNYLSHKDLVDAAKEYRECNNPSCLDDINAKYLRLSLEQDKEAIQACVAGQANCTNLSRLVANTLTRSSLDEFYEALGDANDESANAFLHLKDTNKSFDALLSPVVLKNTAEAVVQPLKTKWGLTNEQAAALVTAIATSGYLVKTGVKLRRLKSQETPVKPNATQGESSDFYNVEIKSTSLGGRIVNNNSLAARNGKITFEPGKRWEDLSSTEQQGLMMLRRQGYDVFVPLEASKKGIDKVPTAEFQVKGLGSVDVYAPQKLRVTPIAREIEKKVIDGQANSIIVVVPTNFSKFNIYKTAAAAFNKRIKNTNNVIPLNQLYFLRGDKVFQFDRKTINQLLGK